MTPLEQLQSDCKNEASYGTQGTNELIDQYLNEAYKLGVKSQPVCLCLTASLTHTCSDKAYVRVVEKVEKYDDSPVIKGVREVIQQICPVDGKIISEVEVTK